jgi:VWFA-related protein
MKRLILIVAIASLVGTARPRAGGAPQSQADGGDGNVYAARATAILVDVVVRDKKGRPVTDLEAEDFQVFEDGVAQEIGSFTVVNRGSGIGIGVKFREPGSTTIVDTKRFDEAAPADEALDIPPATALVFDGLSPQALAITQRAALDYVPANGEAPANVAVFATEPSMHVVQRYTTDVALIRQAIRRVTAAGTAASDQKRDQRAKLNEELDVLTRQASRLAGVAPAGQNAQGVGSAIGQLSADMQLAQGNKRLVEAFDTLDIDHRGYGTTTTLLTVVDSLSVQPGRKTVVLFSEGLPASPAMQTHLQSIIELANRANVTVYAVDASGLRVTSTLEYTRKEIEATGADRLRQISLGADMPGDGPYMRMIERTEDLLRLDPQGGLATLSEDTGGFLVRDTNDIGKAFRRIDEDTRFHYLLTYSPTNDAFDGKFRTIDVEVTRPDTKVFSRKGYRAVRAPMTNTVPDYEAPALALLDSGSLPNAFPVRAGGLVFPGEGGAIVPIIVKVNTGTLQFDIDETKQTYSGQVAIVARIKDQDGQVLQKVSQQYVLSGDAKDADAAGKGEILFYREPRLGAGLYEVESIVYDLVAGRASARVSTVTVPPDDERQLQMSSVMIVAKTERVGDDGGQVDAPLYYGDMLLYPNLGDPVSKSADREVAFYFSLHQADGRPVTEATVELLRNGRKLATAPLALKRSQEGPNGRLQHVGRLPLDALAPGTYELRIAVSDGAAKRSSSAYFTVGA